MNRRFGNERYTYLIAGTVGMLFLGLIYAWSIFRIPFNNIFTSWTVSNLSLAFTISMVFFCIGGFISGRLSMILGNNIITAIASALLFVSFFFISRLKPSEPEQSLIKLYILYGVICGSAVGMGYNAILSAIIKWFPDKPGTISGILLMGYGSGSMVLGSLASLLINKKGLFDSFLILAFVTAIVLFLCSFLIKRPPTTTAENLSKQGSAGISAMRRDYTSLQMIKTSSFWLSFCWNMVVSASGLMVINSAAPIAIFFGAPAVLGLMVSVANGGGRFLFGVLIDKWGRKKTMHTCCATLLSSGICLYTGAILQNTILIFTGLLLVGMSFGSSPSITSAVVNSFFGSKNYQANISIHNFQIIPSAIIGPMVSSIMQGKSNGAYNSTFIILIAFALVSFVIQALLNNKEKSRPT